MKHLFMFITSFLFMLTQIFGQTGWTQIDNPGWEFVEVFDSTAGFVQGITKDDDLVKSRNS